MAGLDAFYRAREHMVDALRAELMGSAADDVIYERPLDRFIVGVLYPQDRGTTIEDAVVTDGETAIAQDSPQETDDPPVALSHTRRPSSCGMTVSVPSQATEITIDVSAARYSQDNQLNDKEWRRHEVAQKLRIGLGSTGSIRHEVAPGLDVRIVLRPEHDSTRAVTLALINTQDRPDGLMDSRSWFQPTLSAFCANGFSDRPSSYSSSLGDQDVESNALLFRNARNLAVGHGCAVDWDDDDLTRVRISFIPTHEIPLASADIEGVRLDIRTLAESDNRSAAADMIQRYEAWVEAKTAEALVLDTRFRKTAEEHMLHAREAASQMRRGLAYLEADQDAQLAFRLMNQAMLQQRTRQDAIRHPGLPTHPQVWRPFQLAFILMNIEALADSQSPDRDTADLLWFPTGGGKTEAYLGLIAFCILLRRIRDPQAAGVSVLMRYTLRLLTLQQFERAAGLICALERVRQTELPQSQPVSLGLWVGQAATPNTFAEARSALNSPEGSNKECNPVQLKQCPWCGYTLSRDDYEARTDRLIVRCPNTTCDFRNGLPIHVVDEGIYQVRPSLVIATVDKFAMMAWNGKAQALFSTDGLHPSPDLIIQDELHLISGPLGTLVGLYETAVDTASSRNGRPKLIASTATIRRATEQVKSVFARATRQFPPPGLDESDSFFSVVASREEKGTRQYVGLMAPGSTHTYLMVRTYAALLQAAMQLDADDGVRDAYWTLMGYFNSLRVLGGAYIQVTDDVPAQMEVIAGRTGGAARDLGGEPKELTSRVPSREIPDVLKTLEVSYPSKASPNVVLATNMISVGLDVERLGLMAVMGQPQANAEYIQATSRVGRRFPGLVVAILNSNRSRDLSHYESFSSFHRALYREVEPNSATPFSPRARDRGLHGALVACARMVVMGLNPDLAATPSTADRFRDELNALVDKLVDRAECIDSGQGEPTRRQLERLLDEWLGTRSISRFGTAGHMVANALLAPASELARRQANQSTFPVGQPPWATLTSLRDVDAESQLFLARRRSKS
jgi:hypothetical protein